MVDRGATATTEEQATMSDYLAAISAIDEGRDRKCRGHLPPRLSVKVVRNCAAASAGPLLR